MGKDIAAYNIAARARATAATAATVSSNHLFRLSARKVDTEIRKRFHTPA